MGFLASLLTGPIINAFLSTALDAFKDYNRKTITKEELEARVREAYLTSFAEVEKSWAQSYAQSYGAFITGAAQSRILAWGWIFVVATQTGVLLWHQIGIPALVYFTGTNWPSSGGTSDWAYALLAALFGAGALMLRPRMSDWKEIFKAR